MTSRSRKDPEAAARENERRQRRLEAKAAEQAARARRQRRQRLVRIAALIAAAASVAGGLAYLLWPDPELPGVERTSNRGRNHVPSPRTDDAAPTSGPHSSSAPRCGAYAQALPPVDSIHALEHGAVVVWYRPDVEREQILTLRDQLLDNFDSHWLLSPNSEISDPVVATAWTRRKSFTGPGEDVIEFVRTYRRRGPERESCDA